MRTARQRALRLRTKWRQRRCRRRHPKASLRKTPRSLLVGAPAPMMLVAAGDINSGMPAVGQGSQQTLTGQQMALRWKIRPAWHFSTRCVPHRCSQLAERLMSSLTDSMQRCLQGQRPARPRSGTDGQKHAEQGCGSPSGWTSWVAATGRWAAGQAPGASLWRSLLKSRRPACGATMRVRHSAKKPCMVC